MYKLDFRVIQNQGNRLKLKHLLLSLALSAETFHTPGPGAYSPERAPPVNGHRRAPSYSMGGRTRYRGVDAVPAPNRSVRLPREGPAPCSQRLTGVPLLLPAATLFPF